MMLVDDLRTCGLDLIGDPPVARVRVGGRDIHVRVIIAEPTVDLRADLPVGSSSSGGSLDSAGLAASGDTAFLLRDGVLTGTRRVISPALGTLYDALFELAKATCATARLLRDLDALRAPDSPSTTTPDAPVAAPPSPPPPPSPAAPPPAAPSKPPPPPPRPPAPVAAPPPPAPPAPPAPRPAPGPPAAAPWRPTHRVGAQGAAAYAQAGDAQPVARLDPWLDVQVIEEQASGWAHVVCSNTWSTWIDRRVLQPL